MSRTADYTIQGFLYEFNKTITEILNKTDDLPVTVNGIFEDIDISTPTGIKAIQCKYHESKDRFTLSDIYKPILLMLDNFFDNPTLNIEYILFAYFPNETIGLKTLNKADIENVLTTKDTKFSKLITKLKGNVDIDNFLLCFKFEIGNSLETLMNENYSKLISEGFTKEDIETIFYPNSIQKIAELAIKHVDTDRQIKKSDLIKHLKDTKSAAITRWTSELATYQKILDKKRNQLKANLDQNSRLRYFVISDHIENFDSEIVNFINDYIKKYFDKPLLHDKTPVFCLDCSIDLFKDIWKRLQRKGIVVETGIIDDEFFQKEFLRTPKRIVKDKWIEFKLRFCNIQNSNAIYAINSLKCDDLFIVSNRNYSIIDVRDVNKEILGVNTFTELKYLLSITKTVN